MVQLLCTRTNERGLRLGLRVPPTKRRPRQPDAPVAPRLATPRLATSVDHYGLMSSGREQECRKDAVDDSLLE